MSRREENRNSSHSYSRERDSGRRNDHRSRSSQSQHYGQYDSERGRSASGPNNYPQAQQNFWQENRSNFSLNTPNNFNYQQQTTQLNRSNLPWQSSSLPGQTQNYNHSWGGYNPSQQWWQNNQFQNVHVPPPQDSRHIVQTPLPTLESVAANSLSYYNADSNVDLRPESAGVVAASAVDANPPLGSKEARDKRLQENRDILVQSLKESKGDKSSDSKEKHEEPSKCTASTENKNKCAPKSILKNQKDSPTINKETDRPSGTQRRSSLESDNHSPSDARKISKPIATASKRIRSTSLSSNIPGKGQSDKQALDIKQRVIQQLLGMSKNKLKEIVSNPRSRKFEFVMKHMMKESRSQQIQKQRQLAQASIQGTTLDASLSQLDYDSLLSDPDLAINLSNLPSEMIETLGSIFSMNDSVDLSESSDDIVALSDDYFGLSKDKPVTVSPDTSCDEEVDDVQTAIQVPTLRPNISDTTTSPSVVTIKIDTDTDSIVKTEPLQICTSLSCIADSYECSSEFDSDAQPGIHGSISSGCMQDMETDSTLDPIGKIIVASDSISENITVNISSLAVQDTAAAALFSETTDNLSTTVTDVALDMCGATLAGLTQDTSVLPLVENTQDTSITPLAEDAQDTSVTPLAEDEQNTTVTPLAENKQNTMIMPLVEDKQTTLVTPLAENAQDTLVTPLAENVQNNMGTVLEESAQDSVDITSTGISDGLLVEAAKDADTSVATTQASLVSTHEIMSDTSNEKDGDLSALTHETDTEERSVKEIKEREPSAAASVSIENSGQPKSSMEDVDEETLLPEAGLQDSDEPEQSVGRPTLLEASISSEFICGTDQITDIISMDEGALSTDTSSEVLPISGDFCSNVEIQKTLTNIPMEVNMNIDPELITNNDSGRDVLNTVDPMCVLYDSMELIRASGNNPNALEDCNRLDADDRLTSTPSNTTTQKETVDEMCRLETRDSDISGSAQDIPSVGVNNEFRHTVRVKSEMEVNQDYTYNIQATSRSSDSQRYEITEATEVSTQTELISDVEPTDFASLQDIMENSSQDTSVRLTIDQLKRFFTSSTLLQSEVSGPQCGRVARSMQSKIRSEASNARQRTRPITKSSTSTSTSLHNADVDCPSFSLIIPDVPVIDNLIDKAIRPKDNLKAIFQKITEIENKIETCMEIKKRLYEQVACILEDEKSQSDSSVSAGTSGVEPHSKKRPSASKQTAKVSGKIQAIRRNDREAPAHVKPSTCTVVRAKPTKNSSHRADSLKSPKNTPTTGVSIPKKNDNPNQLRPKSPRTSLSLSQNRSPELRSSDAMSPAPNTRSLETTSRRHPKRKKKTVYSARPKRNTKSANTKPQTFSPQSTSSSPTGNQRSSRGTRSSSSVPGVSSLNTPTKSSCSNDKTLRHSETMPKPSFVPSRKTKAELKEIITESSFGESDHNSSVESSPLVNQSTRSTRRSICEPLEELVYPEARKRSKRRFEDIDDGSPTSQNALTPSPEKKSNKDVSKQAISVALMNCSVVIEQLKHPTRKQRRIEKTVVPAINETDQAEVKSEDVEVTEEINADVQVKLVSKRPTRKQRQVEKTVESAVKETDPVEEKIEDVEITEVIDTDVQVTSVSDCSARKQRRVEKAVEPLINQTEQPEDKTEDIAVNEDIDTQVQVNSPPRSAPDDSSDDDDDDDDDIPLDVVMCKMKARPIPTIKIIKDETDQCSVSSSDNGTNPLESRSEDRKSKKNKAKKSKRKSESGEHLEHHSSKYDHLEFAEDDRGIILDIKVVGRYILAASDNGTVFSYSIKSGKLKKKYEGSTRAVTCLCVIDSDVESESKYPEKLVTGSHDDYLRCYMLKTGDQIHTPLKVGAAIAVDHNWGTIYVGTNCGEVVKVDTKTFLIVDEHMKFSAEAILAIKATKEGPRRVLIVGTRHQSITVRDADTGLLLRSVSGYQPANSLLLEKGLVYCGTVGGEVPVFDFTCGKEMFRFTAGQGVRCMKIYHGLLFAGCYDGFIYVYNIIDQALITKLTGTGRMILCMDISKNKIIFSTNDTFQALNFPPEVNKVLKDAKVK